MDIQGGAGNRILSMADLSTPLHRVASPAACQPRVVDDSSRCDSWVAVDNAVFLPTHSPDYFPD